MTLQRNCFFIFLSVLILMGLGLPGADASETSTNTACVLLEDYPNSSMSQIKDVLLSDVKRKALLAITGQTAASGTSMLKGRGYISSDILDLVKVSGEPRFYNAGESFEKACVEATLSISREDLAKFELKQIKVDGFCYSNQDIPVRDIKETAYQKAILEAAGRIDPKLGSLPYESARNLFYQVFLEEEKFDFSTASYCIDYTAHYIPQVAENFIGAVQSGAYALAAPTPQPLPPSVSAPETEKPSGRVENKSLSAEEAGRHETWIEPVTGIEFVWVPEGCYNMGCGTWSYSCRDDEFPSHKVCLDGFWLGRYEVTQAQWERVMGNNPSKFTKGKDFPVENVSWKDAQAFIQRLNAMYLGQVMEKVSFRLPTEAEWEYAARSGGKLEVFAGETRTFIRDVAWFAGNSEGSTHTVGTKDPNGLGLFDMTGNVWEWCEDVYDKYAYRHHSEKNPLNTSGSNSRVLRGGSWSNGQPHMRTTSRGNDAEDYTSRYLGFRLVRHP